MSERARTPLGATIASYERWLPEIRVAVSHRGSATTSCRYRTDKARSV